MSPPRISAPPDGPRGRARKAAEIVCLTAQSARSAARLDFYVEILLVGDLPANTVYGFARLCR